jgi:hypothetical protein
MLSAPNARGFFVGDYEGLATIGTVFRPFFVESNCTSFNASTGAFGAGDPACAAASSTSAATTNTNPTDVFTTTVTPKEHARGRAPLAPSPPDQPITGDGPR